MKIIICILIVTFATLIAMSLWSFVMGVIDNFMKMEFPPQIAKDVGVPDYVNVPVIIAIWIGIPIAGSYIIDSWWILISILPSIVTTMLLGERYIWLSMRDFGERFLKKVEAD